MNEKIEMLIQEYEELLKESQRLKESTEQNKEDIKTKADELCEAIADSGQEKVSFNGYTYTPGTVRKYYLLGKAEAAEKGIDVYEPFENDDMLCYLVRKEIQWQSLQSAMREMDESDEGIPEEIKAVIKTSDEFGISRRKADTKNINKVKSALEKRRTSNV